MGKPSLAFLLLSLFVPAERAVAIEGDLIEERRARGGAWFAVEVAGTVLALFWRAFLRARFRIALLSLCALGVAVGVFETVRVLFLAPDALFPSLLLAAATIPLAAFLIGTLLVRLAPALGAPAAFASALLMVLASVGIQSASRLAQFQAESAEFGVGVAVVNAAVLVLGNLVVAAFLYHLPLLMGSVLAARRSG